MKDSATHCFFLEPTGRLRRTLRRYQNSGGGDCPAMPGPYGFHNAETFFDEIEDGCPQGVYSAREQDAPPHDDPRWPTRCACGYRFKATDRFQLSAERIYERSDNGGEATLADAPAGAMWFADWLLVARSPVRRGPDDHSLVVRLPGGFDWSVDGPASNCNRPADREHKCWVRHGDPRLPQTLTVDKAGDTCSAGAGSIAAPKWHGFLRGGVLVPC